MLSRFNLCQKRTVQQTAYSGALLVSVLEGDPNLMNDLNYTIIWRFYDEFVGD